WPDPGNVWLAAAIAGAGLVWWHASGRATALPGGDPAAARRDSLFPLAAGGVLCAVGVIALLDLAGAWHADWRYVLGGMVAALGGVVGLGLLMIAALAVTLAVRVPLFAGFGDRTSHPTTIASLDTSYELGMGNLTLNLADLPLPTGETHVKATLGIGDLTVRVPADAAVDVDARASGGQVVLFGRIDDGTSVHEHAREGAGTPARTLVLDARVGF